MSTQFLVGAFLEIRMTTNDLNRAYLQVLAATSECYEEGREASYGYFKWGTWFCATRPVL